MISEKIRLLFLDDDPTRHLRFLTAMQGGSIGKISEVTFCSTAKEAIETLRSQWFDVVFLDNDLSAEHYSQQDSDSKIPNSGEEVAEFISTMDKPPRHVVIHTNNQKAALRHATLLWGVTRVTLAPFGVTSYGRHDFDYLEVALRCLNTLYNVSE